MQRLKNTLLNIRLQLILISFIVLTSLLLLINDYLASLIFHQPFDLTESLLFKITIILLVIPTIFYSSYNEIKHSREINIIKVISLLVPVTILHVFIASYLIQLIALNLLDSPLTFSYLIKNKFTQDFVFILTSYGLMYLIARYYYLNISRINKIKTLSITTGTRIDTIGVNEIDWISAETPNIALWIDDKKYLYHSNLTDILNHFDNPDFIRIHQSTIVNLTKISSITSCLNGDYDIQLYNKIKLRLSRAYRTPEIDSQLKL